MTRIRVLIWGKTYPELSKKYTETVCTGGCLEDGTPIRLYPVPLRYLPETQHYSLYHWVELPVTKNSRDTRPESYKIVGEITPLERVATDQDEWYARRQVIFRDVSWHYPSVGALKADQRSSGKSIGMVTPGEILDVRKVKRSEKERKEYEEKMAAIQDQQDIFLTEYKTLEFPAYDIRLRWHCAERCAECTKRPHDMKCLDWGLIELARKKGWDAACQKLEALSDLGTYDFRLYMGNFFRYPQVFGVLGFWYPKISQQRILL